ncbi:hypothetical protein CEE37_12365 [candidate division LCP-89 bacterium B3_LCP]|uniref:DNA 3'-5' helicase n=1 Tax=candidate division LCP-89 bacterium B3_LCP TaxID=2012998 RepID=A0A532UUK7_UNCL8|nr:MAG: hypothetical protein CEE37_12365 [candidate division LCP-89 bacterium B3_LCP]
MISDNKINPTPKQREAIHTKANPAVIYAGAGSGKTRVLVSRYLRLLLKEGYRPGRILAATFTNKAAEEMKERVAAQLLESSDEEIIRELNSAPICTLHAFCRRLIESNTLKLGIDPGFRVTQEYEVRLLQEESLLVVFDRWRSQHPDRLKELVENLSWRSDYRLRRGRTPASRGFSRQFLAMVDAVRCAGEFREEPFRPLSVDFESNQKFADDCLKILNSILADSRSLTENSIRRATTAQRGLRLYLRVSGDDKSKYDEIIGLINELKGSLSAPLRAVKDQIRNELLPQLRDEVHADVYEKIRTILNQLHANYLVDFSDRKRELGVLDYSDLEETALELLSSALLQKPVVDCILIDEAQDLNPMQWKIINMLAEDVPIFAVGDAQQSIYGFRHADVTAFARAAQNAEAEGGVKIPLEYNFRSRSEILGTVNKIFTSLWKESSDVELLKLLAGYQYPPHDSKEGTHKVEMLLSAGETRQKAREKEAQHLAQRILQIVKGKSFKVHDREGKTTAYRDPQWHDVIVLVRSSSSIRFVEEAFHELNIPCIASTGIGFWDNLEISDLMALLRALEDPGDSFSLACVLRSPAGAFRNDDLIHLRFNLEENPDGIAESHPQRRSLYQGLQEVADKSAEKDTLARRAADFLEIFDRLLQMKNRLPTRLLIETWVNETDLEAFWTSQEGGESKVKNLRKFLRLCDSYGSLSSSALREMFDDVRMREVREGQAAEPFSTEGSVAIMTVHAAKGLEAPIVAIFDMNYKPRSNTGAFVHSFSNGAAFCLQDSNRRLVELSNYFHTKKEIKDKEDAENERILYVAMTRAKEKLILSASKNSGGERRELRGWFADIQRHLNLADNYLFEQNVEPSGPVSLINKENIDTGLLLNRQWQTEHLYISTTDQALKLEEPVGSPPPGFPAEPEEKFGPTSVVELLRKDDSIFAKLLIDEDFASGEYETAESGASVGQWMHLLLQKLPFGSDETAWRECSAREGTKLFGATPGEELVEDAICMLRNFFESKVADKAHRSAKFLREFPILFRLKDQLFRGKIDLAFDSPAGWTLVDYKSDAIDTTASESVLEKYGHQLRLYGLGWRALTGELPHRLILFFLRNGQAVQVGLDEEEVQETLNLIPD